MKWAQNETRAIYDAARSHSSPPAASHHTLLPQRAMASSSYKGAAEEPEPEPGPAPSSSAPSSYDPNEYQLPHPDDRGGDGKPSKKGGAKAKAKAKGGAEGTPKDDHDGGAHRCGNCDAPDAKRKCKGCGVEYYCGRECQTVRCR